VIAAGALSFTITFHTAFRVGASYGRDGVDAALDREDPLPADHLKGVMRAAAKSIAGEALTDEVFGSTRTPAAWAWTAARLVAGAGWYFDHRHRVEIDHDTHAARKDHLALGELAWVDKARFEVHPLRRLVAEDERRHVALLRTAAAAVHGLGAWRRRGLGWVGIEPDDGAVTGDDLAVLAFPGAKAS
jgi:hypothetical protein